MRPFKLTASQRVYESLRGEILRGVHSPGNTLVEMLLSRDYGVSKTPVREALSMLSQEGLVTLMPRSGWVVSTMSVQDLRDAYEMRGILEPEAAFRAARFVSQASVCELESMVRNRDNRIAVGPPYSSRELLDDNAQFHSLIAQSSGNRMLALEIDRVIQRLQQVIVIDPDIDDPDEHRSILDALKTGDPALASARMRDHVNRRFDRVMPLHDHTGGDAPEKGRYLASSNT